MASNSGMGDFDPNTAQNLEEVEQQFAVKTVEHLEAYEKLITSVPPSKIKLTSMDDELEAELFEKFPEFKDDAKLRYVSEDEMKSAANKTRWREFVQSYEKTLTDYNFGTLLRPDADKLYSEVNSMLVTRAQFVAIEVARNRKGINDKVYEDAQKAKKEAAEKK